MFEHSAGGVTGLGREDRPRINAVNLPGQQHSLSKNAMKVLTVPSSGALRDLVAYVSPFGQVYRTRAIPCNTRTQARQYMRGAFGNLSRAWGRELSQQQRDLWNYAGPQVMSHPRLSQRGPLSGQQHFQGLNSARACIGLPPLWVPPERVVFGLNPVGQLVITNGEQGVRLMLTVSGEVKEDFMVFGQAPCSAGRNKRRNVSYLGLLPTTEDGRSEITDLYRAKFGEPRPGTKVFIATVQQKNGWEGMGQVTSEIVPGRSEGQQAASEAAPRGVALAAETVFGEKPLMHKGCSRAADGTSAPVAGPFLKSGEPGEGGWKAAVAPSGEGGDGKT